MKNAPIRRTERDGGLHEFLMPDSQRLPANQARERWQHDDADAESGLQMPRPGHGDDGERKEQRRKGEHAIHHAHDEQVRPAAPIARQQAETEAGNGGERDGKQPDGADNAAAVERSGKDVAPEKIRPAQMRPRRKLHAFAVIHGIIMKRGDLRRKHHAAGEQRENDRAGAQGMIPAHASEP